MLNDWVTEDWDRVIGALKHKECTPFLGAGACVGALPLGGEIARTWARDHDYPFADTDNLPRVAKYVSVSKQDRDWPRRAFVELFEERCPNGFTSVPKIHSAVARLNLPIHMTTNYDDFMFEALAQSPIHVDHALVQRRPVRAICRWYPWLRRRIEDPFSDGKYEPTVESPVVFHLHGHINKSTTLVITEDDYLEFLINVSEDPLLLPERLQQALAETSLLFLGYRLEDLSFKVLFQRLATYLRRNGSPTHVAVQLAPSKADQPDDEQWKQRVANYFKVHYGLEGVRIYWGSCDQFADELSQRIGMPLVDKGEKVSV